MITNWDFTEADKLVAGEFERFLPPRLFDAHAHLFDTAHLALAPDHPFRQGPPVVSLDVWQAHIDRQVGASRCIGGLFFADPMVHANCLDAVNDFLIAEASRSAASRGLIVIHPDSDLAKVERWLENPQVVGFKVYHTFSPQRPTFEASIDSFLPEWAWEMADRRGLAIMLHLVRKRALADRDNQQYIRSRCLKYGNARLILAHAARGFHAPDTVNGVRSLAGLGNIWFDSSAICESAAFTAILDEFGPRRLMWGSDFPVSELRGKCVTVGDGFAWLQHDSVLWDRVGPGCAPVLVGLESLRAIKQAADDFGLNAEDLQRIFADNAMHLLGVCPAERERTQALYAHAKGRIPGGTQLLSKRPEMLAPGRWPPYFSEARGCEVWDLDGRHYYDMSTNGIGSCLLGFRDPDVTRGRSAPGQPRFDVHAQRTGGSPARRPALRVASLGEAGPLHTDGRRGHGRGRPHRAGVDETLRRGDLRLPWLARLVSGGQPRRQRDASRPSAARARAGGRSGATAGDREDIRRQFSRATRGHRQGVRRSAGCHCDGALPVHTARSRLPGVRARSGSALRGGAHLRRDHHRLAFVCIGRSHAFRRRPGYCGVRQGDGQRPSDRGGRRHLRSDDGRA